MGRPLPVPPDYEARVEAGRELERLRRIEAAARAWLTARDNWTTRITDKDRKVLVLAGNRLAATLTDPEPSHD